MLSDIDQKRIIYLLLLIVMSLPYFVPVDTPFEVTPPTQGVYDAVESMPEGSIAYIAWDFGVMSRPELYPQALALTRHAIRKNIKFVVATMYSPDASLFFKQARTTGDLVEDLNREGYVYGEDYVHLGYYPGSATSLTAFAQGIHQLVKADIDGVPIEDLPLMQQLHTAEDFDIWLVGHYSPRAWVGLIATPYDAKMVCASDSGGFPALLAYFQSGQILGALNGLKGAAEYEKLLGYRAGGTSLLNIQSFSHVFFISLLVAGNYLYFRQKTTKKEAEE